MKNLSTAVICACMALGAGHAAAQGMMKADPAKDSMAKMPTMQECKDHMAMAKPDAMKSDSVKKMEGQCSDMMKKDGMMKNDSMMKKDSMPAAPMKK